MRLLFLLIISCMQNKGLVEPKDQDIVVQNQDSNNKISEIDSVKIAYVEIHSVEVPVFSFRKKDPDTFLEYKACNEKQNCIRGRAFTDFEPIRNMPEGDLTIQYKTCKTKMAQTEAITCSIEKSLLAVYHENITNNSPLKQLLKKQASLESSMNENGLSIFTTTQNIKKNMETCPVERRQQLFVPKELELINFLCEQTLQQIIEALSIAGGLGELYDLSQIIDQKNAQESNSQAVQQNTQNISSIKHGIANTTKIIGLTAGITATVIALTKLSDWRSFIEQQRTIFLTKDAKVEKFKIERDAKNSAIFRIKNSDDKSRFIEDPYTREILYLKDTGSNDREFVTKNMEKIRTIEITKGYSWDSSGFLYEEESKKLFLPNRAEKMRLEAEVKPYEYNGTKISLNTKLADETDKNDLLESARKKYLIDLAGSRKDIDPLKRFRDGTYTNKNLYSTLTVASGVIAVAALISSSIALHDALRLAETTDGCGQVVLDLNVFATKFKSALVIYQQLLNTKVEIATLI